MADFELPPLKDEMKFEELVLDIYRVDWDCPRLHLYGPQSEYVVRHSEALVAEMETEDTAL